MKKYRKAVVGTVSEFKSEAEAQKAVDALRLTINEQTPRQQLQEISVATLVQHYRQHEMPDTSFLQASAAAGGNIRRRKPQVVCHAGHLRRLSEEVDSATLEVLPPAGRKGRAGGAVAETASHWRLAARPNSATS